ncbi:DUF6340 family protein [uncultured Bacteroides sp.]|mgnify:CR=1 FL=1|uniref:DUF6340 family protein n=1 Tax=uncultured Bacteroides sp. TaxID=162156 RepID=UPI0025D7E439|nr:DUF6340 family protein [uncultured Bacteroides sp.]
MAKSYSLAFVSLFLLIVSSCQSLEQISIDYLQPADLSFPPQLRKVGIVNNTSDTPDNKLIILADKAKDKDTESSRATAYANGDPKIATQALAEEIADQNYFDAVVICDSALRANDRLPRESTLSQEEVNQLSADLGVDFIISLENLQFKATKTILYLPEFNCYQGAMDMKVYPTVKVYLPGRTKPMSTLHPNDSIFWEEFGGTYAEATTHMIPEQQMLREAAEFAGTIPVKYLVPIWKTGRRYLYTSGSVQMRDAFVYVREDSWDNAYELWLQAFEGAKSDKKKMQAALNIAVYYEMTDSLAKAEEWAVKAQQLAKKTEKKNVTINPQASIDDVPNYYLISLYVAELKQRNSQLPKLNMQMSRFNDDF